MESAIRAYDRKHSQVQDTGSVERLLTDLKKLDRQEEETARAQIEARIEGRSTGVYDRLLSEISIQRQALRTRLQAAETQATHKLEPRTAAEKVRATLQVAEEVMLSEELTDGEKNTLLQLVTKGIYPNPETKQFDAYLGETQQ